MSFTTYNKRYNALSKQFREAYNTKEIADDLFDLLYELQELEQTNKNLVMQSHIYALLEWWQSAYDILLEIDNSTVKSKLFIFSQKAKTHGDTFGLKDIRKLKQIKVLAKLTVDDFILTEGTTYVYSLNAKKVVIFNKYCAGNRYEIKSSIALTDADKLLIREYMNWLASVRKPIIDFYNSEKNQYMPFLRTKVRSDWYDTLDIYSVSIHYHSPEQMEATISMGDQIILDHIIDLVLENKECMEMHLDG